MEQKEEEGEVTGNMKGYARLPPNPSPRLEFMYAFLWMRDCEAAPCTCAHHCVDAGAQLQYETIQCRKKKNNACLEHMPCF